VYEQAIDIRRRLVEKESRPEFARDLARTLTSSNKTPGTGVDV
jgi:hypothetical protein